MGRAEEDLHDQLLQRIAHHYFVGGMLQSDIAAVEHLSRPSVSRLLTEARERGVVQFRIGPPVDRVPELETELQRRAPLHACIVSTGKPRALYANSSRLGYVAARYLESQLSHVRLLGVASSRSLSGVVESMVQAHRRDLTVIDLLGCLPGGRADRGRRTGSASVDGGGPNTARLIAAWLGASFRALPAPFVHKTASSLEAALSAAVVRETLELGPHSELALVGVGSMKRFDGTGAYSPIPVKELDELETRGAVGHLCGHFLREDGSVLEPSGGPFLLGIAADALRQIPQRLAVAAGWNKVRPIAAAIRGGLISELVTDQATAASLVRLLHP
ncbi:transcriptional regulator LsrR [Arthrobacter sp. Hiyo1]|uniref:sugar-binding transcriptional regulator n=1 Tax=Arthrobacter sp. Hiyo1 TaxID=1588020 RepID=UPI0006A347DE|nr:sugar-binding domain-containing protein [Arthrobacter sp. Hiyo1]GAP60637.1 transcriptional regulator LsrR [Arthrobacter sp. Hiyo1]